MYDLCTSCVYHRPYLFRPQSQDIQDCGGYQTVGVDMVVTGERIILLDTQVIILSVCVYDAYTTYSGYLENINNVCSIDAYNIHVC